MTVSRAALSRVLSTAVALLFCLSLYCPVVVTDPPSAADPRWQGALLLAIGWLGPLNLQFAWFGNPLLGAMVLSRSRWLSAPMLLCVVMALFWRELPGDGPVSIVTHHRIGFYLWIAAVTLGAALPFAEAEAGTA